MAHTGDEEQELLADIAAYLDAHEPLQALWGVSDSSESALQDALGDYTDVDALLDADAPPMPSTTTAVAADSIHFSESSQEQQHYHAAKKTIKGVRNVTRERQQGELKKLRAQCAELEQRLTMLQQQTKQEAPNIVSSAQQKLLVATWKRIAQRQLELRTLAEIENWRLKQQAETHRMIAGSLQQSLHQWTAMEPPMMTTRPSSSYAPRPTHIAMQPCDTIDSVDVEIIRNLVVGLDAEYLRMDHVLHENGLIHWQVASKTSTMHMKTRCPSNADAMRDKEPSSSSPYIEFMEADVIPFDVAMVFKVAWQCWQRRRIPESSGVYEHIPHLTYNDPTTIVTKMRFKVFANGESVELDAYCVLKAYVEEQGRISTVLRAITKADDHFPGVYIDETDWQLMKPMQEVLSGSASSAVNSTAIFACAHMESRQFGGGGRSELVDVNSSPLAKLTASTYEVDTDHVSDMMMNMLLQERSSASCVAYGSTQETAGYVRHLN